MKIHEFQAKELLSNFNVPIQRGHVVYSSNEIEKTIDKVQNEFNSDAVVVKAQIHAGGRGKGGGVKFCPSTESAIESANEILGMNLITHQTGEEGKLVNQILITEALDIEKEFYFALMFDRAKNADVFIVSTEGGVDIESNALFRQEKIAKFHDTSEEDPLELKASEYGLNYIKLDGNVGCMVNGAGLAMATMDIVKHHGGEPANFLDVGGAANVDTIKNGFKIILSDPNVKSVLINIFGGIVRCDRVANGVIQAVKELNLNVGVVVRLQGTNAKLAKQILDESDIELISAETIDEAAKKAVGLVS